ncbi:hypothetical protein T4A_5234 [Trichinella pseudospiralis]|uniref:Uncharacterized protein n=1 Tax=Trichinella pseudospiralis TaxID=6337 RepID=A0A0V1DQD0_TRIPS|nr:hypothetical protein T4A_5234 [Trichinella pseudospiralis]
MGICKAWMFHCCAVHNDWFLHLFDPVTLHFG